MAKKQVEIIVKELKFRTIKNTVKPYKIRLITDKKAL
ncbi:hypothetical protein SPSYN_00002 [Sporotomaculum syntrophicum]|uniref:Uncharacterized protein n=1 Tax=Sporotomaculum syntrophicum TaxID=182264 RepID=A0A9D2WSF8_9FIRM|nr:hypothetical protein SPSYN_00002 [Sporotomaculum syntrophicum]